MSPSGKWEDQSEFIDLMAARPYRDLLTILPNRFNCLATHVEARDPIIRSFHGDSERAMKIQALVASNRVGAEDEKLAEVPLACASSQERD